MDEAKKADLRVEMEDQAERLLELAGQVFLEHLGAVIRGEKRIVFRTTYSAEYRSDRLVSTTTDREIVILDQPAALVLKTGTGPADHAEYYPAAPSVQEAAPARSPALQDGQRDEPLF